MSIMKTQAFEDSIKSTDQVIDFERIPKPMRFMYTLCVSLYYRTFKLMYKEETHYNDYDNKITTLVSCVDFFSLVVCSYYGLKMNVIAESSIKQKCRVHATDSDIECNCECESQEDCAVYQHAIILRELKNEIKESDCREFLYVVSICIASLLRYLLENYQVELYKERRDSLSCDAKRGNIFISIKSYNMSSEEYVATKQLIKEAHAKREKEQDGKNETKI